MPRRNTEREWFFQVVVHLLVFISLSVSYQDLYIELHELFFFLNYALAAWLINYVAFPRFYQNNNVSQLILFAILAVIGAVLIEETVLEKIFYPGNRGQMLLIFSAIVSAFPKIALLVAFKLGWDTIYLRNEISDLKALARQNELQFLRSQIDPHFLFNNLNNLYAYALEQSPKTPDIILELSGLMRYMVYECKDDFVPLSKELEQLRNFIQLNELQIEGRGQVIFNQTGPVENFKIAPLLLIVFVENAFKHSVSSLSEQILIKIDCTVSDTGQLQFTCYNNYSTTTNTNRLAQGVGLANVKKRLELIYGDKSTCHIDDQNGEFTVNLTIELS